MNTFLPSVAVSADGNLTPIEVRSKRKFNAIFIHIQKCFSALLSTFSGKDRPISKVYP